MPRVKVTLNHEGMRELLTSDEVVDDLAARAERVAAAARGTAKPPHSGTVEYRVERESGATRGRVIVIADHPAALAQEEHYRILGSALDAAGG